MNRTEEKPPHEVGLEISDEEIKTLLSLIEEKVSAFVDELCAKHRDEQHLPPDTR